MSDSAATFSCREMDTALQYALTAEDEMEVMPQSTSSPSDQMMVAMGFSRLKPMEERIQSVCVALATIEWGFYPGGRIRCYLKAIRTLDSA